METHRSIQSNIEQDSTWKHKKTGKKVTVLRKPESKYSSVHLLHESGKKTTKEQHYFLYDYKEAS